MQLRRGYPGKPAVVVFISALLLLLVVGGAGARERGTLWNLAKLQQAPAVTWGERSNSVQALYYQGEPLNGRPTRVFAWLGRPEGKGPFPAMVLVHGGGGKAFADWAEFWARRGYVAIAMDLAGCGPTGPLPDGGPDQLDTTKFRSFAEADATNMWTYHAVAAAVRAHSLLLSLPEVDKARAGLTGISWGGYLTCIIAGVDHRFKVAVPVYGCGFLHESSCWAGTLREMPVDQRERWVRLFDPSSYIGQAKCPMLFINGATDFAYPLDSYKKTYSLVQGPRWVSVQLGLPHGHIWTFPEVLAFVDCALEGKQPLARVSAMKIRNGKASATVHGRTKIAKAELCYTTDAGPWPKRQWNTEPAQVQGRQITAALPQPAPLVCFLSVTDERGLKVSTPHAELAQPANGYSR